MERHHPAGRRKDAFLFTVMLHPKCHDKVHANPADARGLLWKGRNSKKLTIENAKEICKSWPFPQTYPIAVLEEHK